MAALKKTATVAVIGAGSMGSGITQVAAAAGHPTLLFDLDPAAVTRAIDAIGQGVARQVERGRITQQEANLSLSMIKPAVSLDELAGANLVIEAVIEEIGAKQRLFNALEQICAGDTLLASNTSSLSISAIGAVLKRPQNLAGMHFFNPAPIMKLVEVVSGISTDPAVAQTLFDTAAAWGKQPVHTRSSPGFIVNRVARPFYAEALRLLEEGAAECATIDAIMRESGGFRMGPFELMDLIGNDVNYAVTKSVYDAFHQDKRFLPSLLQKELVDGGLLGRKSGRGFYDYDQSSPKPVPNTAVAATAPKVMEIIGSLGPAEALIPLWQQAGIKLSRSNGAANAVRTGRALIALSDGRTATQRAADTHEKETVLFDLALDYAGATRIALAAADQSSAVAVEEACGLFQAIGKSVSLIDDTPGLLVLRSVCMLANEGADAVLQQVCDAAAVDTAMQSGVNYPLGPLVWADRIGLAWVLEVLNNLQRTYGIDRYRPSLLLQRKVAAGQRFHPDN